jgi:thiosulfate/3-mercaptopyruvate sulfurtransferase
MTPEELSEVIGRDDLLVVDVRPKAEWRRERIPGAANLNVYDYFIPESTEAGIADMNAAIAAGFRRLGIDDRRTVVYYEEATGMISPRALWFHEYAGLTRGLILDGGIAGWRAIGGPVEAGDGPIAEIRSPDGAGTADGIAPRRELLATVDDILTRDPAGTVILDVRRPTEHTGDFVHPCCQRAGRIPGSVLLFWEDLLRDGRFKPPGELRQMLRELGIGEQQEIISYCHRGARASTAMYALRLAGMTRQKVFVGSWHEWAAGRDLPIEQH